MGKSTGFWKILIFFMIYKWGWPGHASVAEAVFLTLPADVQKNLNLEKMKDGSNDPDEKFHDTRAHSYPASYKRAMKWLDKGQTSYEEKNYDDASYSFGVATHYISDSFAAPHCVSKESGKEHHKYEIVADTFTPNITYLEGDLESQMKKGVELGKADWKLWLKTQDREIVQQGVDRGASAAYTAIKNVLS